MLPGILQEKGRLITKIVLSSEVAWNLKALM